MRRLALALAAVTSVGLCAAASAADLPRAVLKAPVMVVPPVTYWAGWYAGVNLGYGWGGERVTQSGDAVGVQPAINSGAIPASLASNPSGIIGGGQIGFNSQRNRVVFGVEADWQGADISSSQSVSPGVAPFLTTTATQRLDFLGTLRGRIGYLPIDPLLIYVTGGLAYGDVQMSGSVTSAGCAVVCAGTSTSSLQAGWALGVGAEWAVAPRWTAKIEYLHYDLGSVSQTITVGPGMFLAQNVNINGDIVRVGVNHKLDWAAPFGMQ
jgi:outer membrane immunogenic protein